MVDFRFDIVDAVNLINEANSTKRGKWNYVFCRGFRLCIRFFNGFNLLESCLYCISIAHGSNRLELWLELHLFLQDSKMNEDVFGISVSFFKL